MAPQPNNGTAGFCYYMIMMPIYCTNLCVFVVGDPDGPTAKRRQPWFPLLHDSDAGGHAGAYRGLCLPDAGGSHTERRPALQDFLQTHVHGHRREDGYIPCRASLEE